MMTRINAIWTELENDNSFSVRLLLRRYSPAVLQEAYIALRQPDKIRCIAIGLRNEIEINISDYSNLRDVRLEFMPNELDNSRKFLLVLLVNQQHEDVFGILCEDLMTNIANAPEEGLFIKALLNRLHKWKLLFEKVSLQGLLQEEQRGLYGELFFIRKWIMYCPAIHKPVQAWLGPDLDIRDFQLSDWGIEVKTTHGNNHQKIHISNERQLDTGTLTALYLFHLSLESQQQNGETLNELVQSIIELLKDELAVQTQFRSKLIQAGYFAHHSILYENTGYQVRQAIWYLVKGDFPRIEEQDIRRGVGDVKYSIILSAHTKYIVNESSVFETIN